MWQVKTFQGKVGACPSRHAVWRVVAAAWLASVAELAPHPAAAEPKPLNAEVVWARGDRAHIASTDSIPVEVGDLLDFQIRGKTKAGGTVAEIHEAGLITARLTSGSLDREKKKLRDVRVLTEPAPLPRLSKMRIAVPSWDRQCLLFRCTNRPAWTSPAFARYRMMGGDPRVKATFVDTSAVDTMWPDTLVFIPFDDATDQEIALERGEVDLGIFWPGELSPHARNLERWRGFPYGVPPRGILAAIPRDDRAIGSTAGSAEDSALIILNQEVFRGDLMWLGTGVTKSARYIPERYFPGFDVIERTLFRACSGRTPDNDRFLVYLDAPPLPPDSVQVEARNLALKRASLSPAHRRRAVRGEPIDVTPLYRIRCPLVCEPRVRRLVTALGPDQIVALIACRAVDR